MVKFSVYLNRRVFVMLVPLTVSYASRYNLRNSSDLQTVEARTSLFYNSFLPSTVRAHGIVYLLLPRSQTQLILLSTFLTKIKIQLQNTITLETDKLKYFTPDCEQTVTL